MASVSGTSSLGNTSLRGFGGMATGIDRDSIIQQMTAGTNAKITKQKNSMTLLSWKQEAYQSISGKMLALQDKFFSFSSGANLRYAATFAKNQITAMGDANATKYVSATGSSSMVDHLSILGVKQTATSATRLSDKKGSTSAIDTEISSDLTSIVYTTSRLKGTDLRFGTYNTSGAFQPAGTFTFPASYKETVTNPDGSTSEVVHEIDYTNDNPQELVNQLNEALKHSDFKLGDDGKIEFAYNENGDGQITIKATGAASNYVIRDTSTALSALGFDSSRLGEDDCKDGISLAEFNDSANKNAFADSYIKKQNMVQYLTEKSLSVTYGGQTKQIELLRSDDVVNSFADGKTQNADGTYSYAPDSLAGILQSRLDKAFGSGKVIVDTDGGKISFSSKADDQGKAQSLTITSDDAELRKTLGIAKNASNNLSMDASLWDNRDKLGFTGYTDDDAGKAQFEADLANFTINGTAIKGLTADTTVNGVMEKINGTKGIGVKASYLKGENQFVLVAEETGSGREIQLGGMAETMFGTSEAANNRDGDDAIIEVSYGNGVSTTMTSSSNTFDLEGLKVTVSGTFGYKLDADGNATDQLDPSQAVTFSAKADVDGVTEQIKQFIEDYNELIKEINAEVTTKPNKAYGPLTEAQKAEMSETSIENWEKMAKKGLLYNDNTMRELSMSVQGIVTSLLGSGVSNKDLEEIGISISDGWMEGGTIAFDENKFKAAMSTDPEMVSDIFTGSGDVKKGLAQIVEDTFTPYATKYASRNGNSYGRLIEEAGSMNIPNSVANNQIYKQLQEMQKTVDKLNSQLRSEQDRFISKFSTMETLISQMNAQSGYLSQIGG
ncbi:MAG: flagellar filament capping protein FliD [Lachnospiraceae bacterium]